MIRLYLINKNNIDLKLDESIKNIEKRKEKATRDYLVNYVFNLYHINNSDVIKNEKGKPYIKDNKYYFNISHSGDLVILAMSDNEVGVDIEKIDEMDEERIEKLMNKISNDEDYNEYVIDDIHTLKYIWTIKESYLKYKGIGLINNIKSIYVNYKENMINDECFFYSFFIDDYVISLVSKEKVIIKDSDIEWVK